MLSNTLNTNEVKNSAGTEVEFSSISVLDRSRVFAQISETPSLPHRLTISHQESGKGINKRRRSMARIDRTSISTVDSVTPVVSTTYIVSDSPVGAITTMAEPTHSMAELLSFMATTGSGTTVLFDGSGNGANALLTGGL